MGTLHARRSNLLSALLGGVVAVALGAILIVTGALHGTTTTRTVVEQLPLASGRSTGATGTGGLSINDIYRRVSPGVAFVQAKVIQSSDSPFGQQQQQGIATGSGFVWDGAGHVVTNAHVVEGAGPGDVQVRFGTGQFVSASIVGRDVSSDIAVLKIDPTKVKLTQIPVGESGRLEVGDPVVAIGNPFGYDDTVTQGIVSALQRQIEAPNNFQIDNVIQTDAAINPGNSGGPLLNSAGQIIGINSQIATTGSNGSVGIGFAIPIDLAKGLVPTLISKGSVQHAYVGVTTTDVTPQLSGQLGLPVSQGALIQDVVPSGPADRAGLRGGAPRADLGLSVGGDIIVAVAGKPVHSAADIAGLIAPYKPGQQITISYYRGKTERTATVTLANRPASAPSGSGGGGGQPPLIP